MGGAVDWVGPQIANLEFMSSMGNYLTAADVQTLTTELLPPLDALDSSVPLIGNWPPAKPDQSLVCSIGNFTGIGPQRYCFDPMSDVGSATPRASWRVRVFDLNGDGRDDVVALNLEDGTSDRVWWDAAGKKHVDSLAEPIVGVGDFDGDGITDVIVPDVLTAVSPNGPVARVRLGSSAAGDYITQVADEKFASPSETVAYTQTSFADTEIKHCHWPEACLRHGMHLATVSGVHVGTSPSDYRVKQYSYDDPRIDLRGDGFLGFASVREFDRGVPRETLTEFDNTPHLPAHYQAFLPQKVTTWTPTSATEQTCGAQATTARIFTVVNTYQELASTTAGTYFIPRTGWNSVETEAAASYDICVGAALPHFNVSGVNMPIAQRSGGTKFDLSYGQYGNVSSMWFQTQGGVRRQIDQTYYSPVTDSDWVVANVNHLHVTSKSPTNESQTRTVKLFYSAAEHPFLPGTVLVEPNTTDPSLWQRTDFVYDSQGLPLTLTVTVADPNPTHLGGSHRPGLSRSVSITYDPEEGIFPRTITDALGTRRVLYHPAFGFPLTTIEANGVGTYATLYDLGQRRSFYQEGGTYVLLSYSLWNGTAPSVYGLSGTAIGEQVDTIGGGVVPSRILVDPGGHAVHSGRLSFGGSWSAGAGFDTNWNVTTATYDLVGQPTFQCRPALGSGGPTGTSLSYDPLGRLTGITLPDGNKVQTSYVSFPGKTDAITIDPVSRSSILTKDADGRITQSTQFQGASAPVSTSFTYGPFDKVKKITDPVGNIQQFTYDVLGRVRSSNDTDRGETVAIYNGFGEPVNVSHAGEVTTLERDALGRVTSASGPDGETQYNWVASGSGVGALNYSVSPDGTRKDFSYDQFGRTVSVMWSVGTGPDLQTFTIGSGYDAYGRISTVTYPQVPNRAQFTVQRSFNSAGYLNEVAEIDGAPLALWKVLSRNADGTLDIGVRGNELLEIVGYDAVGRMKSIVASFLTAPSPVESLAYDYYADGRVSSKVDAVSGRKDGYQYDGLGRLAGWQLLVGAATHADVGYKYDAIGNLLELHDNLTNKVAESDTYGFPGGCAPLPVGCTGPTLSHALNTATLGVGATKQVRSYTYDARGRQISSPTRASVSYTDFELPREINSSGGSVTAFLYDADGQRVRKATSSMGRNPGLGPQIGTTITLAGLFERRQTSLGVQDVFYVPGSDGRLAQVTYDEQSMVDVVEYVHSDRLGSTSVVTPQSLNSTNQPNTSLNRTYFDPFGRRTSKNGGSLSTAGGDVRVGFAGLDEDDDVQLVNMNGRVYDPNARHFLSADPIVAYPTIAESYNTYSYAMNDPGNLVDRSGYGPGDPGDTGQVFGDCPFFFCFSGGGNGGGTTGSPSGTPGGAPTWQPSGGSSHIVWNQMFAPARAVVPATPGVAVGRAPVLPDYIPKHGCGGGGVWCFGSMAMEFIPLSALFVNGVTGWYVHDASRLWPQDFKRDIHRTGSPSFKYNAAEAFVVVGQFFPYRYIGREPPERGSFNGLVREIEERETDREGGPHFFGMPVPLFAGVVGGPGRSFTILAVQATVREIEVAEMVSNMGLGPVVLRDPVNITGVRTSDMLVNNVPYDIYTPTTSNPNRIISAIASKNGQAAGVVLDLSRTPVTVQALGNILARVQGAGATNILDIIIVR
jgi:RHS repeat-associated protein